MLFYNKLKAVLGHIKVAQINHKKKVILKVFSAEVNLLNTLWKNGFIYGYTKIFKTYIIFLKYNIYGIGLLTQIIFLTKVVSQKELYNLLVLDPHTSYIIITTKTINFCSFKNITVNFSGLLIAKL